MTDAAIAQQIETLQRQIDELQNPDFDVHKLPSAPQWSKRVRERQSERRAQRERAAAEQAQRDAEQRERERPAREKREGELAKLDQQLAAMQAEHKHSEDALIAKRAELRYRPL